MAAPACSAASSGWTGPPPPEVSSVMPGSEGRDGTISVVGCGSAFLTWTGTTRSAGGHGSRGGGADARRSRQYSSTVARSSRIERGRPRSSMPSTHQSSSSSAFAAEARRPLHDGRSSKPHDVVRFRERSGRRTLCSCTVRTRVRASPRTGQRPCARRSGVVRTPTSRRSANSVDRSRGQVVRQYCASPRMAGFPAS